MKTPIVVDLVALEDKLMRLKVHSTQSFHRPRIRKMLQEAVSAAYERGVAEGIALYQAGFHPAGLPAPATVPQLPQKITSETAQPEAAEVFDTPARTIAVTVGTPLVARVRDDKGGRPAQKTASPRQPADEPLQVEAKPVPYRLRRRKLATA